MLLISLLQEGEKRPEGFILLVGNSYLESASTDCSIQGSVIYFERPNPS